MNKTFTKGQYFKGVEHRSSGDGVRYGRYHGEANGFHWIDRNGSLCPYVAQNLEPMTIEEIEQAQRCGTLPR